MMAKIAGFAAVTSCIRATKPTALCAWTMGIDKSATPYIINPSRVAKTGSDRELGTRDGWKRSTRDDLLWTQQIAGSTGIPGRAPTHLTFSSQPSASNEFTKFSRNPARPSSSLAGEWSSSDGRRQEQELLWRQFFLDPTLWSDSRQYKKSFRSPDFRRKGSHEFLWLNNFYKPAWVDEQLAALDIQMGHDGATTSRLTLCEQWKLAEAVEALEVLVQTDRPISKSLFYTILKQCVAEKDLDLGRRVHALTVKKGYQSDTFLCNHILRMYASHARLQEAMDVFTVVARPDAFMWSSIISAHVKLGHAKQAIQLYHQMRRSSVKPSGHVFVAALQACARGADLESGQQVHADVLASGVELDLFVVSCLLAMYAKCGSLKDAQKLFDGLGQKNVVTWNAMIAGYAQTGMGQEALHLYSAMQEEGITIPDSVTFVSLLQACASVGTVALEKGTQLHAQIREQGLEADLVVANSLINMYAKCGKLEDAQRLFDRLRVKDVVTWNAMVAGHVKYGSLDDAERVFHIVPEKDVVTWTAMIAGYSQQGMGHEALHLYCAMQEEGIAAPNSVTFVCLLQACASVGTTAMGKAMQLHAQIREQGLEADVVLANSLINMYTKCGRLEDAQSVFDRLSEKDVVTWNAMVAGYAKYGSLDNAQRVFDRVPQKNVVTWNALIAGYSQQGMDQEALHLYSAMQEEGITAPNSVTFVSLLQACASVGNTYVDKGKQLHAQIVQRGLQADVFVANGLINMYAKCGSLEEAHKVFDGLRQKDVVTWNAMIAAHVQKGTGQEALHLYSAMQEAGIATPNSVTFLCILQACANLGTSALERGKQFHVQIREQGLHADVVVGCSLVNMYAKCGSLEDAQRVFEGLHKKDVVTWNSMIAGYSQQGMGQEALHLYSAMQEEGISAPDSVTFVGLLQACAGVGNTAVEKGKQLHAQIKERGLEGDVFVANSLINMYAKCGSLEDAQRVFDGVRQKDVVTWNSMIAGYSQRGMGQEALHLYSAMQGEGIAAPDSVTFVCLLQACANVAGVHLGRHLHAQVEEQGLQADVFVANSLIHMYAKFGSMVDAQQVFDALPERDVFVWNALIAGYTSQGDSEMVFALIHRMTADDILPDNITFLHVLTVCSHAGLVDKGREYFEAMITYYDITPMLEHYTCMVDLLGRAGHLEEALEVARSMPVKPHDVLWHALLCACRNWSNVEVGRYAFDEAVKLDEKDAAAYVMMCNIYAGAQMWKEAQEMQVRRRNVGARKEPGQSWWTDMSGIVHAFVVGDTRHPESEGIYARLKQMVSKMKKEGYLPQLDSSLQGISDDQKEAHLEQRDPDLIFMSRNRATGFQQN